MRDYEKLVEQLRSVKDTWQSEEEQWMLDAADAIEELCEQIEGKSHVTCETCKHAGDFNYCPDKTGQMDMDDYCSWGEKCKDELMCKHRTSSGLCILHSDDECLSWCVEGPCKDEELLPVGATPPVMHGKWEQRRSYYVCSVCSNKSASKDKYCSQCGSKMDLEGEPHEQN